jgi:spore coat polysaccharide biosynthesis predicted glycosyltransferase SpsG
MGADCNMHEICFIVQADMSVGMGHLIRSISLIKKLRSHGINASMLILGDANFDASIKNNNIKVIEKLHSRISTLVFDCLHIPCNIELEVLRYKVRVLISPEFAQPHLVTHALVRNIEETFKQQLSTYATIKTENNYGFTSVSVDSSSIFNNASIDGLYAVGLCLTGGAEDPKVAEIAKILCANDNVAEVRIKTRRSILINGPGSQKCKYLDDSKDLWSQLSGVNVFVGGDGLMLYEAVYRNIFCLSLTSISRIYKNKALIDAGFVTPILIDESLESQINDILMNTRYVADIQKRLQDCRAAIRPDQLTEDLIDVIYSGEINA